MYALVDGNNFYVNCERVFRPSLNGRPVVVLSNNDGCAIARSNEAKVLGIKMGAPWFQIRHLAESDGLIALSANFVLYGDPPAHGHVMVMIEYQIDPTRAHDFRKLMQEGRRNRVRHGVLSREPLQDLGEPGRFVEMYEDESWSDHLRRFDRLTAADVALRNRKLAFHIGESPPQVTRSIMETTVKTDDRG